MQKNKIDWRLIMKCKFCEEHKKIKADTTVYQNTMVYNPIHSNVIVIDTPDGQQKEEVLFSINFCPYCGKKLYCGKNYK